MKNNSKKYIFIGAAWPYANDSLHLGHIASLLPADIIARYYRLKGNNVLFVSGSDCHGTPIVVSAEKENKSPQEIAEKYHEEFEKILIDGLNFSYDLFTTTLTDNHKKTVQEFFIKLYENKDIVAKVQKLPYCSNCKRFLPDRYIEGTCPKCSYKNARGDQCDECGAILDPEDLLNPQCKTCGATPIFKESKHFFLKLSSYEEFVEDLVARSKHWRKNAIGFTNKLLSEGLRDRAITRDTAWGIDIPLEGYDDKKIYVWFDAVCGYFSASKEYYKSNSGWKNYWENKNAVHYYVHGKDNIPFHTIIWPIMLEGYGKLKLPDYIISSEYLTLDKKQFSKSRKWAVWAKDFLKVFDGDLLRFQLTINGPETSDSDFSWKDFQSRINSELIGNFGNFVNRSIQLISNNFDQGTKLNSESDYLKSTKSMFCQIGDLIERGDLREALRQIIKISEGGNKYLAENEPWKLIGSDPDKAENVLANCACSIINIQTLISPFLPTASKNISDIFGIENNGWKPNDNDTFIVKKPNILFAKIEDSIIEDQLSKLSGGATSK